MASLDTPDSTLWAACAYRVRQHPVVAAAVLMAAFSFLFTLRRVNRLRRPIPGIPYNPGAVSYMLGDIPAAMRSKNPWMLWATQGVTHNSPLTQIFMRPFQQPWVLVTDPWLSADIFTKRTKEFDRSDVTGELFGAILPGFHLVYKSADPHFKKNKELVRELMTPSFINEVTAPQIYHSIQMMIDLWYRKIEMAGGRPFETGLDIHHAAIDIILGASFGFDDGKSQIAKEIRSLEAKESQPTKGEGDSRHEDEDAFEFKLAPLDDSVRAFTILMESVGVVVSSPAPRLHHFLYRNLSPKMRKATALRNRLRDEEVTKSLERRNSPKPQRCALDQLLTREDAIAAKEGREANYRSVTIMSELLGYLGAGHETTSAVLRWALKYLVHNQHAQKKLRDALHSSYPDARKQSRRPTLEEILRTNIPYVDAVIDETLRCAWVLPLIMRQALVDTQILGKPIPKGTTLVLFGMGPGLTMPALKLDDEESQKSVEAFRNKVGSFDENNMDEFLPERWLKTTVNKSGQEETVFNANAGPTMGFGHGPRSCFGRRMATAEIKIFLTLVIWSFEMLPLGPKLWNMDESLGLTRHPKDVYLKLRKCS